MTLTPKQEKFAQLYVELGNASEAYRQAYSSKTKPEVVHVKASELLATGKVSVRIDALRKELEKQGLWRREDSVKVLSGIALGQDEDAKPADRVSAVRALNAMHGWDKQVVDVTNSDGTMAPRIIERVIVDPKNGNSATN